MCNQSRYIINTRFFTHIEVRCKVEMEGSQENWRPCKVTEIPNTAFVAGHEKEGQPIFVARASHKGDLIPGKAIPALGNAFISWDGGEIYKEDCEVLIGKNFTWTNFYVATPVPERAVVGGRTKDDETLYIGKVKLYGVDVVGKIQMSHGSCYVPYAGKEVAVPRCEILIRNKEAVWERANSGHIPPSAFLAGNDHKGPIYVCRSWHENDLIPGKAVPAHNAAYVSYDGREHIKLQYEVLCGHGYFWAYMRAYDPIPKNSVPGGHAADFETLYIGRVKHENVEVCGKIHPSHRRCFIPYGGAEVAYDTVFEILCFSD